MAADASSEDGFSLVEVVVALGLLAFVLAGMAYGVTNALAHVGMSKQRQTAVAMANQLLEEARAVPYAQLTMRSDDLATDPRLEGPDGAKTFKGMAVVAGTTAPALLAPHLTTSTPDGGPTTYERRIYVSQAPGGASRIVTVQVAWSPATGAGQPIVELQTLATPYGCEAQEGTGPCDPYWYASADSRPPTVRVTGTVGAVAVDTVLRLDGHHAQVTTEQYTTATADAAAAGAQIAGTKVAGTTAIATSDDAASTSTSAAPVSTAIATPAATAAGSPVSLSISGGGSADAIASARAPGGTFPESDGLGHSRARSSHGTSTSTLRVTLPDGQVVSLAEFGAGTTVAAATADRAAGTDLAVLDDDTVVATAARTLPTVRLVGLPAGFTLAAGQTHLATVTGWTASATATAGPKRQLATPGLSGSVQWWNGSSYATRSYGATGVDLPVAVARTVGSCTLEITGTLTAGGYTETPDTAPATPAASATGRVDVASAVSGTLRWVHTCGAAVTDLTIGIDLGRAIAETRYAKPGG